METTINAPSNVTGQGTSFARKFQRKLQENGFNLKTYNFEKPPVFESQPLFFLLNKGYNSGKPLHEPCPNCFGFYCEPDEQEFYFNLCFFLWKCQYFKEVIINGTVIEFLRIDDAKNLIYRASQTAHENRESVLKIVEGCLSLNRQIQNLEKTKQVLNHRMLRLRFNLVRDKF